MYALSIFIHYPNYTYRNPNANPGPIFGGLIFRMMNQLVYRGAIFGEIIFGGPIFGSLKYLTNDKVSLSEQVLVLKGSSHKIKGKGKYKR